MKMFASPAKKLHLFPADSVSQERIIRNVSFDQGSRKEAAGAWKRVHDTLTGELRGFQLISPEASRMDIDLPPISTSATILDWEMELNLLRSQTAGLPEKLRDERIANHELPEDEIERVQRKVWAYPRVGPGRGDILRVWPA